MEAGSSGLITLTSPTIWLRWEQAVSGGPDFVSSSGSGFAARGFGSVFAGRGETVFTGSNLPL